MKEADKAQWALANLLIYLYHNEKDATNRLLRTNVFAKAAVAVSSVLEDLDKDAFDAMKKPDIDADEYTLAAMQEMVVAQDRIRELEREIQAWKAKWSKYHNAMAEMYTTLYKGERK